MNIHNSEPCYVISVVARMLGVHAQTLRYYEKVGLIEPSRSEGRIRLYSNNDIERLRQVRTLMNDLGINLAGVEVILRLNERIEALERQLEETERDIERLRQAGLWPKRMLPASRRRPQISKRARGEDKAKGSSPNPQKERS